MPRDFERASQGRKAAEEPSLRWRGPGDGRIGSQNLAGAVTRPASISLHHR
jgi:hypothetical protein